MNKTAFYSFFQLLFREEILVQRFLYWNVVWWSKKQSQVILFCPKSWNSVAEIAGSKILVLFENIFCIILRLFLVLNLFNF